MELDASFHADPSLTERGSSRKLRAPILDDRARVGSVDPADAAMKYYDSQGFEALASTRADSTDQQLLTDGGHPESVDCATCGATARRVTWGATACTCYRCQDCHAGGHIAPDGTRQGGVFEELNNLSTRLLNGASRVVTDGGLLIDDDEPECPSCDATDWRTDGRLTCRACGYTPRASVRGSIRDALGGGK